MFRTSCHKHAMLMLMRVRGTVWRICGTERKRSVSKARLIMTARCHRTDGRPFCAKLCTNPNKLCTNPKILFQFCASCTKGTLWMRLDNKPRFLLVYKHAKRSGSSVCINMPKDHIPVLKISYVRVRLIMVMLIQHSRH